MEKPPKQSNKLRRINNFLSVLVLISALYLVAWPFIPKLDFWWKTVRHYDPPLVLANENRARTASQPVPLDNILVIPRLHSQEIVYEGPTAATLSKGVWHRPQTSTPDKGGNTVMAGHRFTYYFVESGSFYNLDKMQNGDEIFLYWNKIEYTYRVSRILTVLPTDIDIEKPTKNPILTLYTCTPLWTNKERLVVQASLVKL